MVECPIKCGYCCTHFMDEVTTDPNLSDAQVQDAMQWRMNHTWAGREIIECKRTLTGYTQIINIPCKYLSKRTGRCTVHGTEKQPWACKRFLCDRAREALREPE